MVRTQTVPAAFEDLTARARIRDAAMRLFTQRGFAGASIRDIAEAASVSPGLIRHHFGSKDALRAACDAHASAVFRRTKEASLDEKVVANPLFVGDAFASAAPAAHYLGRALADGSPGAKSLFDEMVAFTQEMLTRPASGFTAQTTDLTAYAAVLTAMSLGMLVLHEHISRALGDSPGRWARAVVDIHSHALISPEYAAAMQSGIAGLGTPPPSHQRAASRGRTR